MARIIHIFDKNKMYTRERSLKMVDRLCCPDRYYLPVPMMGESFLHGYLLVNLGK